jgi:hypothetical protein
VALGQVFSTIIFTITRGWHNRPGVAAVAIASQIRIKKKTVLYIIDDRVINEYDAVVGMRTSRRHRSIQSKPTPVPLLYHKSYMT